MFLRDNDFFTALCVVRVRVRVRRYYLHGTHLISTYSMMFFVFFILFLLGVNHGGHILVSPTGICTGSEEYKKVAFGGFFSIYIIYMYLHVLCIVQMPMTLPPDVIGEPRILKIRNRTEPPPRPSFLGTRS